MKHDHLAIDLGSSNGRILHGVFDGERLALREVHRFPNNGVRVLGELCWDAWRLWSEIQYGIQRFAVDTNTRLHGLSVNTWGVDFGLLDKHGRLLGAPYHYRDSRTDGVPERLFRHVPRSEVFRATGIEIMQINSLYQLFRMAEVEDPRLDIAHTLLWMPDLFHYWFTGRRASELSIASTSQMLAAGGAGWAESLLRDVGLPIHILPELVKPGTVLDEVRSDVAVELGLGKGVPVIASAGHDTAAAVAATTGLAQGAYISSGSWSLIGVERHGPVLSEQALAHGFTNEAGAAGTTRLLKNVTGLWLIQECRRDWRRQGRDYSWEELLARAKAAEPFRAVIDPDDTRFLNPRSMPQAILQYCRTTGQPEPEQPGEMVRCCLESLALKYRQVVRDLEQIDGRSIQQIRIVGGGSQNELLNQFTADASGLQVLAGPVEATAMGNLMLQLVATGVLDSVASAREALAASIDLRAYAPQNPEAWEVAAARLEAITVAAPSTTE